MDDSSKAAAARKWAATKGKILHFPKDRLSLAGVDFPLHDDDKKEDKDDEEKEEE